MPAGTAIPLSPAWWHSMHILIVTAGRDFILRTVSFYTRFIMTILMALLLWCHGLKLTGAQAAQTPPPVELVRAFQTDYLNWNNRLLSLKDNETPEAVMSVAIKTYGDLLAKYTLPDFVGEPVAFGSESSHDPVKEKVLSVKIGGTTAVVRTEFPGEYYTPTYEYRLVYQQNRWYLTAVDLVDDDGKFPSL